MVKEDIESRYVIIMKMIQETHKGDVEHAHVTADKYLCNLLKELGYDRVVDEYEKIEKWYV